MTTPTANCASHGRKTKAAFESAEERPPTLPVNPDGIPAELKALPQWVCWRWVRRDGKWTKVPVNPRTGKNARPNDPATAADFDTALKRCRLQPDRYAGLGFLFTPSDPYTGVDLDDARDPETGDIDPWAAELLAALDGYAEVSPSGTGAKVIVRAVKPAGRCQGRYQGHKVEVYDRGRFFALTGHGLPDSTADIPDRQAALGAVYKQLMPPEPERPAAGAPESGNGQAGGETPFRGRAKSGLWGVPYDKLTDDDLAQLAGEAKNGNKFRALWSGDTGLHGGDDSAADLALCDILAFWCQANAGRVDRLFRRSGLMRPKWDEPHYADGRTYGQGTVAKACASCEKTYRGPSLRRKRKGRRKADAGRPHPAAGQWGEEESLFTVEIIRAYWRERYDFCFRRGKALYSRKLAREVQHSEACFAPCTELVDRLELAVDAPEDGRDGIPRHFREWAKVAWVDEWNAHQDETSAGELVDPAREQFRALVRGGLLTVVALAHGYQAGESGEETKVQKKPLLHWARSFAKGYRWMGADVRGLSIWAKKGPTPALPRVALRVEVFGQVHYAKLAGMPYEQFASLCELYDVGTRCKVQGGDTRAVELLPEFVADALDVPLDEPTGGAPEAGQPPPGAGGGQPDGQEAFTGARPREDASFCPGSEETHAPS
jgi:hypothetical protein